MIEKIKKLIKNLFDKIFKKETKTNNKKEEQISTLTIDDISFNDELELSFGSIILGKRYKTEKEKFKIAKGHRTGPYIVVGYKNNKYICLYCSGEIPIDDYFASKAIKILSKNYEIGITKDTYINIVSLRFLNKNRIIDVLCNLNDDDKIDLLKRMELLEKYGTYKEHNIHVKKVPLDIGDIFKYNKKYHLIISKDQNNYNIMELEKNDTSKTIKIGNIYYEPLYNKVLTLSSFNTEKRYAIIDKNTLDIILKKSLLQRGSLTKFLNKFYYIYGEFEDNFMAFRVYQNPSHDMACFSISNKNYYSDFRENITFSKKDKFYELITLATESQIKNIKNTKETFIKSSDEKHPKQKVGFSKKPNILSGVIAKGIIFDTKRFIVLERFGNQVVVLNQKDFMNGNYDLKQLNVDEIEYYDKMNADDFEKILDEINTYADNLSDIKDKSKIKQLLK